jgi:hypothetical protein
VHANNAVTKLASQLAGAVPNAVQMLGQDHDLLPLSPLKVSKFADYTLLTRRH